MKLKKFLKNPIRKRDVSVHIPFGKPVCNVSFGTIKTITTVALILIIINILYSLHLFHTALDIKNNLGDFINMISKGDGHVLPLLQVLPTLIFLILDIVFIFLTFKLFTTEKQPKLNWAFFFLLIFDLVIILITFILMIYVLSHSYSSHEKLHNGIKEAMDKYSGNSAYKIKIDRLQIEFNCCGSKKYDEWYNVVWYNKKLAKQTKENSQGDIPFSCCSMTSIFPCIHNNIENTGKVYLYTPEQNLSISTDGCYKKIRDRKKTIGWQIVGSLFLMQLSQLALLICLRFLQTGHYVESKFSGHNKTYTIWLIGMYIGKKKESKKEMESEKTEDEKTDGEPPEPPPVPPELKE